MADPLRLVLDEIGADDASLVGLFHLVNNLLPDEQAVVSIPPDASVAEALSLMAHHGFSQLPVMVGETVLGVFSYRSFAHGIGLRGVVANLERLDVDDFIEQGHFTHTSDELEGLFGALDRDGYVLVGDRSRLVAVATSTDVIRYLYAVTHPFVLIQEIELALRGIVRIAVAPVDIGRFIARALTSFYRTAPERIPTELGQLTLRELVSVTTNGDNYNEAFAIVLGRNRESARAYLDTLHDLRNTIFHFRRALTAADLDRLVDARSWLLRKAIAAEARGRA